MRKIIHLCIYADTVFSVAGANDEMDLDKYWLKKFLIMSVSG